METRHIINTGIIGYGMAGKIFHAPFIHQLPGFNLKKICTTNEESIRHAQSLYKATEIVASAQDILKDNNIELVIIVTPNESHFPLAKEAILEGKHVIVDKPFTITLSEADELIALAKEKNTLLTVYHNRRWVSDFFTVKKLIASGMLVDLVEYVTHLDRFRPELKPDAWREADLPGSGVFYDLGSHLIDQALCLFGMPESLTADIQIQRPDAKVDDYFSLTLQYPTLRVSLNSGMLARIPGPVFLLHGLKGSFVKYGMDVQEAALNAGHTPDEENWGEEPKEIWGTLSTEVNGVSFTGTVKSERGNFAGYFTNVYHAITGKEAIDVTPEQARNVMKIIELSLQSSKEKRTIKL